MSLSLSSVDPASRRWGRGEEEGKKIKRTREVWERRRRERRGMASEGD
jgi:hypothetical protein